MAEFAWSGWALSYQAAHLNDKEADENEKELRSHGDDPFEDHSRPNNRKRVQQLQWPLFPTPTLASLQISGYEMYNNSLVRSHKPFLLLIVSYYYCTSFNQLD